MGSGPGRMWKWEEGALGADLWAFFFFWYLNQPPTHTHTPSCENHALRSHLSARLTPAGADRGPVSAPPLSSAVDRCQDGDGRNPGRLIVSMFTRGNRSWPADVVQKNQSQTEALRSGGDVIEPDGAVFNG